MEVKVIEKWCEKGALIERMKKFHLSRIPQRTMGQNGEKFKINSHLIIHLPTSKEVIGVS